MTTQLLAAIKYESSYILYEREIKYLMCAVQSLYNTMFVINRNGLCYKWTVLELDNFTKEF